MAQEKSYVNIPTIPGESTDPLHVAWIDGYGLDHTATRPSGGGAVIGEVAILKGADRATPFLHEALVLGTNLGLVKVELCGAPPSGPPRCYYRVELTNAKVTKVSVAESACASGSCTPAETESVTFTFSRIQWVYTDPAGTVIKKCWDIPTNLAC
jgi:type VI secretion system Hcp family effector